MEVKNVLEFDELYFLPIKVSEDSWSCTAMSYYVETLPDS